MWRLRSSGNNVIFTDDDSDGFWYLHFELSWGIDESDLYGELIVEPNELSSPPLWLLGENVIDPHWSISVMYDREQEQPFNFYQPKDYVVFFNSLYSNYNEGNGMLENSPIMSNELLKVKTFQDLMAVRSLTGIMRLNEHHFNNGYSTYLREAIYTINALNEETFAELTDTLESLGYLVEVRSNTERNKTCNAYRVFEGLCTVAVVLVFDDNKLKYYGYTTTEHRHLLQETQELVSTHVKEQPIVVNYVTGFNDNGAIVDHREIALDRNVPIDQFYPFIEGGIDELAEGFIKSTSNLLLLVGPRGTGKTTLLREFCRRYKAGDIFQMCGDKVILNTAFDSYLASLPEKSLVIIEDADAILGKRTDQNTSLSMLLNELDGIANKGSKFVITTNLENLKSVDSAVLRVGRCYKTIAFRELSAQEANVVADKLNYNRVFSSDITLAEVFNGANQKLAEPVGFRPIGQ